MPTIELSHELIRYIQKLNDSSHEPIDWSDWLPIMGCPVDNNNEDSIEIEVFPDRPDLLSHETMAKASRSLFRKGETKVDLDVNEGEI